MKLGIVGLPNVGKSTLFNAITQAGAESANYPFCTIEPNVGVVAVPDDRLKFLTDLYQSEKTIPAAIEFYDIAGLVRGASKGEGLGNKFLSHIREVASILQVVRCFEDSNITHVEGSVNPLRDIETINLELIFSDLEMVEKRLQKSEKLAKGDKSLLAEVDLLKRIHSALEEGLSARSLEYDEKELEILKTFNLLSMKPIIYIANVAENEVANEGADNPYVQQLKAFAKTEGAEVVVICAKIEAEISELEEEEKAMFLEELGLNQSGLDRLVQASYSLLGLISYLTAGPKEVRAWTIKKGTKAPQAAGKIHSDFERGFIRAEVVAFDALVSCGTYTAAKEKGLVRLEGKEYVVQDGDVILFRFNV
ncbi:redox-regulated ATPase YchF [Clostridium formicaceticum]|uniref:Ribosome-binding ATPase YchF n=1 Tax=Clostridium formicaceticum TaxID=1497 RepID=A0AAC9RJI6_9CLOT|nr:redox-regulated ATPase YchF [Clostridium formicaceticum]AOY75914.1 redox-regulated ATPase YchF [Clostridium formicaceticum]ARE86258.1 Ribosome-binding ATPase YchF [Clostridium formicaceticum]